MKYPPKKALDGLWNALNAAEATPSGGDFTEEGLEEVDAAIVWLRGEVAKQEAREVRHNALRHVHG